MDALKCGQFCQWNFLGECRINEEEVCPLINVATPKEIKDSGERTQFETGAVRDMHAGKGRMDLLPWHGILAVSRHCENGAVKYGEHNVDKGIPLHSLLDSAARHLGKVLAGMDDEDHLVAAAWNLLWALNQRVTHPELDDLWRGENNGNKG